MSREREGSEARNCTWSLACSTELCVEPDFQTQIEKELTEERERNKDDIAHLESLEKHYTERVQIYEVRYACVITLHDT